MLKKKKFNISIGFCILLYLTISTFFFIFESINAENIFEEMENISLFQMISSVFFLFVSCFIMVSFKNIFIILLFFGIKLGIKHAKKDKLTDVDFGKYKGYYKEIIDNYSPAILAYVDSFEIKNKDIISTLLDLKLRKYIDINNKEIVLLNNNLDDLNDSEKYLIQNINNYSLTTFESLVIDKAINQGLLEEKDNIKKKIKQKVIILILGFILAQVLFHMAPESFSIVVNPFVGILIVIGSISIVVLGLFYPVYAIIYLLSYMSKSKLMPYVRTKNGNIINTNLEGLKNYIKDYSLLKERKYEELELWEEYLIYSVLFEQNEKILKDFEDLKFRNKE